MRIRGLLVLAILAALVSAPPTASASTNLLDQPEATPASGTTATLFQLRVSYEGRFPALGVAVTVADRVVAMSLLSGSSTDGMWQASVRLPAGTWPVVFTAVPERGNSPTLLGPTLTVVAETAATASPTSDGRSGGSPTDSAASYDAPEAGTVADPPAAAGTAAPAPAPAEDGAVEDGPTDGGASPGHALPTDPTGPTDPTDPPPTLDPVDAASGQSPSSGGGETGSEVSHGDIGEQSPAEDAADASAAASGDRPAAGDGPAAPFDDDAPSAEEPDAAVDDGLLGAALRISAVWAAMLLVAGAVMLGLLLRRRRREAADVEALTMAAETEALLERRALRRAHVLMPEDPIVASMTLDEREPAGRRAERRRRARRGDGEKP